MLIAIIGIIAAVTSGVVAYFVQMFTMAPRQLDVQKIGEEVLNTMIEGVPSARGMRFRRTVLDASATQFSYLYGYPTVADGKGVRFRWDSGTKHLYRSTSTDGGATWSTEEVIPYYLTSNPRITIDGKTTPGVIFTYKKAGDVAWVSGTDALNTIRRLIISIKIETQEGSGVTKGSVNLDSSCEIKGF